MADTAANDSVSALAGADEPDADQDLRQLVTQTLEHNGVLPKLRAQLRASVFLALDDRGQHDKLVMGDDEGAAFGAVVRAQQRLRDSEIERMCIGLVREWLQSLRLDYTLSVLNAELGGNSATNVASTEHSQVPGRQCLVDSLGVCMEGDTTGRLDEPSVLSGLIHERLQSQQQQKTNSSLNSCNIRSAANTIGEEVEATVHSSCSASPSGLSVSSPSGGHQSPSPAPVSPPATLSSPTPPSHSRSSSPAPVNNPIDNNIDVHGEDCDEDSFFDSLPRDRPVVSTRAADSLPASEVSEAADSWSDTLSREGPTSTPAGGGQNMGVSVWSSRDWNSTSAPRAVVNGEHSESSVSEELETPVLESLDSATLSDGGAPRDFPSSPEQQLKTGFVQAI